MCNEAAAIAVAMKEFPPGHNPHGAVARLLPYEIAINWRGGSTMGGEGDMPGSTPEPDMEPAWLVAILGDGMTVEGYSGMPSGGTPTPIGGMWYILMAFGGNLGSTGGLPDRDDPSGHMTYASIVAIESQQLDLTWRTPTPWPTLTPGPPPTSEFDLDEP